MFYTIGPSVDINKTPGKKLMFEMSLGVPYLKKF